MSNDMNETKYFDQINSENKDIVLEGSYLDSECKNLIVACRGHIDSYNAIDFGNAISKTIQAAELKSIILDLESVNYISALGLSQLSDIMSEAKDKNINFKLYNVNQKIKDIFSMLGFSQYFMIIEDLDDLDEYSIQNSTLFPINNNCPYCYVSIKIPKPGKFVCQGCNKIIRVGERGDILNED